MKRIALILLCGSLAACNQTTAQSPATTAPPPTADISDKQAFAAARATVLEILKDPDSAKFGTFTRTTISEGRGTVILRLMGISVDQRTDLVCGTVNSKNGFGGYGGPSVFAYRIARKDIWVDRDAGGERFGSLWCIDNQT